MTIALALLALALPCLILAAWQLDRRDHLASHERDREMWHRERQMLLNRIKPETAQYVAEPGPVHVPTAPRFDDDDAYWQTTESTDELADRLLREELQDRVAPSVGE